MKDSILKAKAAAFDEIMDASYDLKNNAADDELVVFADKVLGLLAKYMISRFKEINNES